MKPTKKKPVKRAATCKQSLWVPTVAKSASVEPMVHKYKDLGGASVYWIYERDLPRVVVAFARVYKYHKEEDEDLITYNDLARAQLRAIGIDVGGGK